MVPPDAASLLAEVEGLRRLARVLVRGDDADDLAQDALATALEHPPRPGYTPRAWLSGIARRLASNRRRADARRRARETAVSRKDVTPSSDSSAGDSVAEHLERRRLVLEAVAALPEDSARVVCLRYFDDLPPRAIAQRLRVPVETVRTRLKRALARLREELDRRRGDRRAWCVVLAPLADAAPQGPTPVDTLLERAGEGAAVAATSKIALVAGAALLLAGGGYVLWRATPPSGTSATRSGDAVPEVARAGDGAALAAPRSSRNGTGTSSPGATSDATRPAAASVDRADGGVADGVTLSGRILDEQGKPLAGARVRLMPDGALPYYLRIDIARRWSLLEATTDAEGRWRVVGVKPGDGYALAVSARGHAVRFVGGASWRSRAISTLPDLALENGIDLKGRVVTSDGTPVVGARVAVGPLLLNPLGIVLARIDAQPLVEALTTTDADGRWHAAHVGAGSKIVVVEAAGLASAALEPKLPIAGDGTLPDVVLHPALTVSGRASFTDGTAAAGTRVLFTTQAGDNVGWAADADADGAFTIAGVPAVEGRTFAFLLGFPPLFGPLVRGGASGVELRFARPGKVVGRVVADADGSPIRRFTVRAIPVADADDYMTAVSEKALAAVLGPTDVASEAGDFAIEPLAPRAYRIEVVAPGFAPTTSAPVEVGVAGGAAPLLLRLAKESLLSGTVVDADGHVVAGAEVLTQANGRSWGETKEPSATGIVIEVGERAGVTHAVHAGDDGRFSFPTLAPGPQGVTVRVRGFATWFRAGVDAASLKEPLRVVLTRGATVSGRLSAASGSLRPDLEIGVVSESGRMQTAIAADGSYRLEHVPAGRWTLLPLVGTPIDTMLGEPDAQRLGATVLDLVDGHDVARDVVMTALPWLEIRVPEGTKARVEDIAAIRMEKTASGAPGAIVGPFVHRARRSGSGAATAGGAVVLDHLLPGTYSVTLFVTKAETTAGGAVSVTTSEMRVVDVPVEPVAVPLDASQER